MSSDLNYKNGRASMAYNRREGLPWHREGQGVDGAMTSKEAIELANLDYTVEKAKIAAIFPPGSDKKAVYLQDKYATYRTDTLNTFGIVSDRYEIVQNSVAFDFMDSIVGEGKAIYETAGALGQGETVFITAKLPYYIRINGEDTIENYLVVSNGHDGKSSLNIFMTPIRIVCANTLAVGLANNKFKIKLRHTAGLVEKLEDARNLLAISSIINDETQEILQHLTKIKVTDETFERYVNNLVLSPSELQELVAQEIKVTESTNISTRKKNVIKDITKYYYTGVGQANIVGTAYGAYNSVNGYLSNVKKYSSNNKMESLILGGSDYKLNNRALDLALKLEN